MSRRANRPGVGTTPRIDPPVRTLDGSTASTATRCSGIDEMQAERFDERRLAGARRAADPDPGRGARRGQDRVEEGNASAR